MLENVALVACASTAVTLFAAGLTVAVNVRTFEGFFAGAFLSSYFATLLP